jgi:mannose-6-phosphate isomerase-like protein (cupin superfamily)
MKLAMVVLFTLALSSPTFAQSSGKTDVFSSQSLSSQLTALEEKAQAPGSAGSTLADYGSHKLQLSARTMSGGAEIHAHFDDVMIVQHGSATLITGGNVLNPKTSQDGETKGTAIKGGMSRTITVGDIVTVNAGVPHQLVISPGTTYSAVVVKVKE